MKNYLIILLLFPLVIQASVQPRQITVSNAEELYAAVAQANQTSSSDQGAKQDIRQSHVRSASLDLTYKWVRRSDQAGGGSDKNTIILKDGLYRLPKTLVIRASHITLKSASGDPDTVILQGNGMKATQGVDNLLDVHGQHVTLTGITLQQAGNHLIQLRGEKNADHFKMNNCVLRDAYEQLFKITSEKDGEPSADNGIVKNSLFEYSAGIGPQFYIGGIDLHSGKNWLIENNTFRNIASPSKHVAEHAIHIWKNSADNIVRKNLVIDSDRGIGFGLSDQWFRRNSGGEISENIIIHRDNGHPFADVGIALEISPGTRVLNNIVYLLHGYPYAIEYRFAGTKDVVIEGNLVNKAIKSRDGGSATLKDNQVSAGPVQQLTDTIKHLAK